MWVYKAMLCGEVDCGDGRRVAKNTGAAAEDSEAAYSSFPSAVGEEKKRLLPPSPYSDASNL